MLVSQPLCIFHSPRDGQCHGGSRSSGGCQGDKSTNQISINFESVRIDGIPKFELMVASITEKDTRQCW